MRTSYANIYLCVKWAVYILLCYNVYLFFGEEHTAASHTFAEGISLASIIEGYSATIDTAAWVILLLLFELETTILPDERIVGWVKWALHGVRGLCYVFIVYALYGYFSKLQFIYGVSLPPADLCALGSQGWLLMVELDVYELISGTNCSVSDQAIYQLNGLEIAVTGDVLTAAQRLAWVDLINAADWILVVIILEIDVRMQHAEAVSNRFLRVSGWIKAVLYAILFTAAVYWGIAGSFLDFWDAFLWLFAFAFIEMNVFQWQAETRQTLEPEVA